jgi:hypothetical protein
MSIRYFALIAGLALLSPIPAEANTVIYVKNVEALYAAVNNPENAGAEVRVAGGKTYLLTYKKRLADGTKAVRPNDGRLVLQPGMSLVGENAYRLEDGRPVARDGGEVYAAPATETIIDGSYLDDGPAFPEGTGAIVSLGARNSVHRLTIRSNESAKAAIAVETVGRRGITAVIVDCTLDGGKSGGRRGVMILHLPDSKNALAHVTLKRNVIRHHRASFGYAIHSVRVLTSGVAVSMELKNNVIYDNHAGLFLSTIGASVSTTFARSVHNLYRGNERGIVLSGGRDFGFEVGSSDNVTDFASDADTIIESQFEAVFALGGLRNGELAPENSNNSVYVTLRGTQFVSPTGPQNGESSGSGHLDLVAYGALSNFAPDLGAGVNNVVELNIKNLAAPPIEDESVVVYTLDADVPEPTNRVKFIGGEENLPTRNPNVPIVVLH